MVNVLAAEVGTIMGDAGLTILIGLVVVFGVLLLLTGVFKLFGMAMSVGGEKVKEAVPAPASVAPVASVAPIVGNTQPVQSTQEIQNGIPAETVAVISAAVACMAPAGTQYAVRGIRKA
ncbi:MAG: OadG family protein [Clostridia bacterium]|nr:OadG family protein [Clostridia bacterium]